MDIYKNYAYRIDREWKEYHKLLSMILGYRFDENITQKEKDYLASGFFDEENILKENLRKKKNKKLVA